MQKKKQKGKVRNRKTRKKEVKVSLFTDDMTVDTTPRGSRKAERDTNPRLRHGADRLGVHLPPVIYNMD